VSVRNVTQRPYAEPKAASTGVVLEAHDGVLLSGEPGGGGGGPPDGGDWGIGVEPHDDASDHSPAYRWCGRLHIQQPRSGQPVAAGGLIEMTEVLEGTAHGKQRRSTPDGVAQRISDLAEDARDGKLI